MDINKITDVFGKAIKDFHKGKNAVIDTYSSIAGWDELPVKYLFRSFEEMPDLERTALKMAFGEVLDLGCGAGSHSLYLQNQGLSVKPIDISKGAIEVCKLRGLEQAEAINLWDLKDAQFDTILALMNGAGICGSMKNLPLFLKHLVSLLKPGGQILMDSSDLIYLFDDEEMDLEEYYGELKYKLSYKGEESDYFDWLYIDASLLEEKAKEHDYSCKILQKGDHFDYLAVLNPL